MVIKESSPYQTVEVSSKRPITKNEIINLIRTARRTRSYIKFTVSNGKYYIMVSFHRNGAININSNIRFDQAFQRQLVWLERRGFAEGTWAYFICEWINRFAQKNYK